MRENKNHFGLRFGRDAAGAESATLAELAKANTNRQEVTFSRPRDTPPEERNAEDGGQALAELLGGTKEDLEKGWAEANAPASALTLTDDWIDLKSKQVNRGFYEELKSVVAHGDWQRIPTIVEEQFDQLHRPEDQLRFLRSYVRIFPLIAAKHSLISLIPILESTAADAGPTSSMPATESKGPRSAGTKSKSQRCAEDVATIDRELHKILPSIDAGDEDLQRLQQASPRFLTFKAIKGSPQLRDKILALPYRQGRLLGLAQQLAGVLHERKPDTVKKDWNLFKPPSYRQSK
jgi:hypothetical protein